MHLTGKDLRRYLIYSLVFIWLILFAHLFYLYLQKIGQTKYVKGGVFIEGVVNKPINPIPYIGNNYYSKYIQSFFFKSCLNSKKEEDLCKVKTNDYKIFKVYLKKDIYWTDGRKLTLDDIYFTYNDVLRNNQFLLESLNVKNIKNIERKADYILVEFLNASVNNKAFFENFILPVHLWKNKTKEEYVDSFLRKFVSTSCEKFDNKSDYVNNIILDLSDCKKYYIDKYQLKLLKNQASLRNYLSGTNKVDVYNGWENILPEKFNEYEITLSLRYALFWNVKRQTNLATKVFISKKILSELKDNLNISRRVKFNGYGLFILPNLNLDEDQFKKNLLKEIENIKKYEFESSLIKLTGNTLYYKQGENNKFYVKNIKKFLTIRGTLLTGGWEKIGIVANSGGEYILKSYKGGKNFKYIISEKFKNIKSGKNIYKIFAYRDDKKLLLDTITIYYKKIIYPKFNIVYPEFNFVYLNNNNKNLVLIGDAISDILKKYYPGKVNIFKVSKLEYENILKQGDYDLVLASINFEGKDISPLFKIKDPIINPSRFINKNFASLINQNLLASLNLKKDIFVQLNKIYQENIPVVFLGNAKEYLFVNKKYNIPNLDYSYFENRKKMLENIVLKQIKQPLLDKISIGGFINFLKEIVKKGDL